MNQLYAGFELDSNGTLWVVLYYVTSKQIEQVDFGDSSWFPLDTVTIKVMTLNPVAKHFWTPN